MEPEHEVAAATTRLVFLHGFTQTHHHWHRAAFALAQRLRWPASIVLPDLPGHGLSADDRRPIDTASTALTTLCGPGTYIGYSMGGRYALVAACAGAREIERLVVIGASPGIENGHDRRTRLADDEVRAEELETDGVAAFVERWAAMPMFSALRSDPDDREHRLRNTVDGLANSLRTAGTGAQPVLWERLAAIAVPVLVIAGEHDEKFTELGVQIADAIPNAAFASIAGAGHAAHHERPDLTVEVVAAWLEGAQNASPTARSTP